MPIENVNIKINAEDNASASFSKTGKNLKLLGAAAAAASVAIGVKAVQAAAKFEKALGSISTLIDKDVDKSMQVFSGGIKEIMRTVPASADDLGAAAYDIVSAGISEAGEALLVLEESARLGVAGLGSASEATDLMTSSINAFQLPAENANSIADTLFKTVKAGKTTISELAVGFGKVAPVAQSMNVTFEELQAATAAVTTTGIKASEVQTGLKAAMASMIKPTADLMAVYEDLGVVTGKELIEKSGGLVNALQKVKDSGASLGLEFGQLMGSVEGLTVSESLLGAQNEAFTETLRSMTEGSNAVDEAFTKQTETFAAQWELLQNQLQVILIDLGSRILPILIEAAKSLTIWVNNNRAAIDAFVTVLAGVFQATIWLATNLVVGLGEAYITGQILMEAFGKAFNAVWGAIKAISAPIIEGIKSAIDGIVASVQAAINALNKMSSFGQSVGGSIRSKLGFADGGIVPKYFATGGVARGTDTVPAMLTPGEVVLNAAQQKNLAGKLQGVTVNITGTFLSQGVAEEIGDMVVQRLQLSSKVV